MKNMHIIQFLAFLMTLFALEKNAVGENSLWTFNRAVKTWQNNSCIFPDKSLYTKGTSIVIPKLDQCRLLENRSASGSPDDDLVKASLCDAFYRMSSTLCDKKWQSFVQKCLNPELVEKSNPFADKGVCSYIIGNTKVSNYFTFLPTVQLCHAVCEIGSMKPVCELYALIMYQSEHQDMCSTSEKQPQDDKIEEDPNKGGKPTSVTQESVTTLSTVTQTKSTSIVQLKGLTSENATLEQEYPETVKSSESSSTAGSNIKSTATVNGTQLDEASEQRKDDLKASDIKSTSTVNGTQQLDDTSAPKKEHSNTASNDISTSTVNGTQHPIEASAPKDDSNASAPKKNELEIPSLLLSKITSADTAEKVDTETTTPQEEEITTTTTESSTLEDVKDDDGNYDDTDEDGSKKLSIDDPQNESSLGQSDNDKTVVDKSKNKTPGDNTGVSKVKLPEELETGKKQSQNTLEKNIEKPADGAYDDSESSPGSGHFLAYFLTAVVICISGYVIYHNKQKILAFIIEGRHSGRGGRQRSKDVKYSQLKSNVEEVMPSLEQTATGKNFVY